MLKVLDGERPNIVTGYIKQAFKEKSKSLKEFSEKSGLNRSTISRHLNGKIPITNKNLQKYSAFLGQDPQDFYNKRPIRIIGKVSEQHFRGLDRVDIFNKDDDPYFARLMISAKPNLLAVENLNSRSNVGESGSILTFSEENKVKKIFPDTLEKRLCFLKIKYENIVFHVIGLVDIIATGVTKLYYVYPRHGRFSCPPVWAEIIYGCPINEEIFSYQVKYRTSK